jgi:hypothetical protein
MRFQAVDLATKLDFCFNLCDASGEPDRERKDPWDPAEQQDTPDHTNPDDRDNDKDKDKNQDRNRDERAHGAGLFLLREQLRQQLAPPA